MKFSFDKQKFILVTTKYLAYLINIVILAVLAGGVVGWIFMLYKSSQ